MNLKSLTIRDYVEGLGIILLIVSLIFVGLELRQNSQATKLEANEVFVSSIIELNLEMASNPILAKLVRRAVGGNQGFDDFELSEQGMLFAYYLAHVYARSGLFTSIEEGVLPDNFSGAVERTTLFDNEFFRDIWPLQRDNFDESFITFFEAQHWNSNQSEQ